MYKLTMEKTFFLQNLWLRIGKKKNFKKEKQTSGGTILRTDTVSVPI